MTQLIAVSEYQNITNITRTDPNVASILYNSLNSLYGPSGSVQTAFLNSLDLFYADRLANTKTITIALSCIFAFLVLLQAPLAYLLNLTVCSQVRN